MDRPGTLRNVAPGVGFALSDSAKCSRGVSLIVDGCMSSHILSNHPSSLREQFMCR